MTKISIDSSLTLLRVAAAIVLFATIVVMPVRSDVLELKDGTVLEGMYMGGSQTSMRFRVNDDIQVIPIEKILALTVTGRAATDTTPTAESTPAPKVVALPAGSKVYGQVVTAKRGGIGARPPVLELKLIEISINGELRPITTDLLSGSGEGGGAGGKVLKGAAIGGLASGSSGAEDGAKLGLAVSILGGGKHAGIKSGTLLEFRLTEAMSW